MCQNTDTLRPNCTNIDSNSVVVIIKLKFIKKYCCIIYFNFICICFTPILGYLSSQLSIYLVQYQLIVDQKCTLHDAIFFYIHAPSWGCGEKGFGTVLYCILPSCPNLNCKWRTTNTVQILANYWYLFVNLCVGRCR